MDLHIYVVQMSLLRTCFRPHSPATLRQRRGPLLKKVKARNTEPDFVAPPGEISDPESSKFLWSTPWEAKTRRDHQNKR